MAEEKGCERKKTHRSGLDLQLDRRVISSDFRLAASGLFAGCQSGLFQRVYFDLGLSDLASVGLGSLLSPWVVAQ